jgi:hypothetical protein
MTMVDFTTSEKNRRAAEKESVAAEAQADVWKALIATGENVRVLFDRKLRDDPKAFRDSEWAKWSGAAAFMGAEYQDFYAPSPRGAVK